ncbi:MAG TPA: LLM class F420-dependent oxidoreductase [Candidatus Limnocylindrales bacterium]|jgi:F420-dependent oxidoreductase-like protein
MSTSFGRPFFGLHLPNYTYPGVPDEQLYARVIEQAQAAEAAGFELVTVMDHFYQIRGVGPEDDPMLEAYSALAGIAVSTKKVRLGTLVTGVTYRNPAMLAKLVTTLDVMSGGRAILGIGAAWNESEHAGMGFDFPPIAGRMDRLGEALTICKLMFTEDRPSFEGQHYRIDQVLNRPRPIQAGGPPILIGGMGERRTLRFAAEFADMTHWFPASVEDLQHKVEVLAGHCEAVGRDPSTIIRTMGAPVIPVAHESEAAALLERIPPERRGSLVIGTPARVAEHLSTYIAAGFTGFTFGNTMLRSIESIGLAGEVLKLLA